VPAVTPRPAPRAIAAPVPPTTFEPLPEWTAPLVWTPQGRRPRLFAHLLIRLLVVTPLPVEGQAWVIAFPFSLGWSFVEVQWHL
jgi:hypothetical protein